MNVQYLPGILYFLARRLDQRRVYWISKPRLQLETKGDVDSEEGHTPTTGRMFAYRSIAFRRATMGEE